MLNDFLQYIEYKKVVDDYILNKASALLSPSSRLVEAVKYSLLSAGKRLRAVIFLAAFDFYNSNICQPKHDLVKSEICFAIEALHTYTLIHDDLPCMDDDSTRRGRPSNHKVFGEAQALLAGDALLNLSMECACNAAYFDSSCLKAIKYFFEHSGMRGVIGGQSLEFDLQEKGSFDEDLVVIKNKTAALFKAAAVMGGMCANVSDDKIELLKEFGLNFGIAFQIKDDIDDLSKVGIAKKYGAKKASELLSKYVEKTRLAASKLSCNFFMQLCDKLFN